MNVPPKDYFKQKLTELKSIGLQWADKAKKVRALLSFSLSLSLSLALSLSLIYCCFFCVQVAADSGALPLDKVFELISEGENLPVLVEKELKVTDLAFFLILWLFFCS